MPKLNDFRAYVCSTLLPKTLFRNLMPSSSEFETGSKESKWSKTHYYRPAMILEASQKWKDVANKSKFRKLMLWYINTVDLSLDANIKRLLAERLILAANSNSSKSENIKPLNMFQSFMLTVMTIPSAIASLIIALPILVVVEALTMIIETTRHLIWNPLYYLAYKRDYCQGLQSNAAELNKIEDVANNTLKNTFKFGLALPLFRAVSKIVFVVYDLYSGVFLGVHDVRKARMIIKNFNSTLGPQSEATTSKSDKSTYDTGSSKSVATPKSAATNDSSPLMVFRHRLSSSYSFAAYAREASSEDADSNVNSHTIVHA